MSDSKASEFIRLFSKQQIDECKRTGRSIVVHCPIIDCRKGQLTLEWSEELLPVIEDVEEDSSEAQEVGKGLLETLSNQLEELARRIETLENYDS